MREFFRGWKRKLGVLTLVIACLFAAGWVRSLAKPEGWVVFKNRRSYERVVSTNGAIRWEELRSNDLIAVTPAKIFDLTGGAGFVPFEEKDIEWKWHVNGFGVGEYHHESLEGFEMTILRIPYWSIVLPLTLLSTWFLLSKPRTSKFKPTSGP